MKRACALLVIASILVAGCAAPSTATPVSRVVEPTQAPASASAPLPAPTVQPTEAPHPPVVVQHAPAQSEEAVPQSSIVVQFDQPMDPDRVELLLRPEAPGRVSWDNDTQLRYQPQAPLALDTRYTVEIVEATSANGQALPSPVSWSFRTVGELAVVNAFPAPGSQGVTTEMPVVRLVFNRPVAALGGDSPDPKVLFEPPLAGDGEWTSTSVWTFTPEETLRAGATYTITLAAPLESVNGASLADDYVWSFSTSRPHVDATIPAADERYAPRDGAIEVMFSQAMDRRSCEAAFVLLDAGQSRVTGSFAWLEGVMSFRPDSPLEPGMAYTAFVGQDAMAADGEVAMARPTRWSFRAAPLPELESLTPADGVTGVLQSDPIMLRFTSPISRETLLDGLVVTPTARFYPSWMEQDTVATLSGWLQSSTRYTVTVGDGILGRDGTPLQRGGEFSFTTGPAEPLLSLDVPGRVGTYNAYARHEVTVWARNLAAVQMSLYALERDDVLGLEGQEGWRRWEEYRPQAADLLRRWTVETRGDVDDTQRINTRLTPDSGLEPGYYMIEAQAPGIRNPRRHALIVSPINLVLKAGNNELLVWATDLAFGQPVADLDLTVYDGAGMPARHVTTDQDGIATAAMPDQESWDPLVILSDPDGPVAAVSRTWEDGIAPWAFGLNVAYGANELSGYLSSDRAIYRPGQTAHLKGILRRDLDARYALLPDGAAVLVEVHDVEDRVIVSRELGLNDMGTFALDVALDGDAKLGRYWVEAAVIGHGDRSNFYLDFTVAEYRKPAFELEVTPAVDELVDGDDLAATATAAYYAGGAVADARVDWRVRSQPWVFDRYDGPGYWSWTDWELDGMPKVWMPSIEFVAEGHGRTDAEGRFNLDMPAHMEAKGQSQRWTVEVSVSDAAYQQVSARDSVIVHRADVYVGVSAREMVGRAGNRQTVDLLALDPSGKPVPGQEIEVVFYRHEWYSVKQEADDGKYYWTNAVRDTPVVTRTVIADVQGRAQAWFVPAEGGTFKVVASSVDEEGRKSRAALYLWVSGMDWINWGQSNDDRIELVADKSSYAPGDVAEVLVPSPFGEPVQALLTIERGDVLEHRVITLASNSEVLELPIVGDYAPNVFVSLAMVRGMGEDRPAMLKVGYATLPVSIEELELDIKVDSDKGSYAPGDMVRYTITTRDHAGRGVPAEVSLQLVDRAVLALTGAEPPRIVDHFYHQRGLGVRTAATLVLSVDRRTLEYPEEGKGGGGGEMKAGDGVRSDLVDTAYWAAQVTTGEDGVAVVDVPLPDNLTTWRMTAVGVTAKTLVGFGQHDVVSSLPLQVRPIAPRFLLAGDRPVLGALVQNGTDEVQHVTVSLEAMGITVPGRAREVLVEPGQSVRVTWQAQAEPEIGEATLRYRATTVALQDAVEINLPILPPSYPEYVGTSGIVADSVTEVVMLPEGASRSQGELSVTIEPSLASAMATGLGYLRTYPYLCVEQTVSRFLPNVAVVQAMSAGADGEAVDRAEMDRQVLAGIQRLTAIQNLDGGWGWWPGQDSQAMLTSYVVMGLAEARDAGYALDERTLDRGVSYLYRWMDAFPGGTLSDRDLLAQVLYALAQAGQGDLGRAVALADEDASLSLYGRALLAMTLHRLDPHHLERAEEQVAVLMDQMIMSASGAHWEEATDAPWTMNTNTRTTALVLKALVAVDPDSPLLPQVARWLLRAREAGRWSTTYENAWAILALTDYAVATGGFQADYGWNVALNGMELARGDADHEASEPVVLNVPVKDLMLDTANLLRLNRDEDGAGRMTYSAFLSVYRPADSMEPLDRGMVLRREYTVVGGDGQPVDTVSVGDTIQCKLTLIAPHDAYYLILEDPLPAGCEAIDTSLATSSMDIAGPLLGQAGDSGAITEAHRLYWEWHYAWASHTEMRDDRVALFADRLPRGTYEYTYQMRCTTPGEYQVLPATAYGMYAPDVYGRSAGQGLYIAGAN